MTDVIFASGTTNITPASDDRLLLSDTSASGAASDCALSDLPISTATQTALDAKQDTLVSATNIKTINSTSLLGPGNIVISGAGSVTDVSVVSANGLAGTVATSTSTPEITLSTTVTGLLKGNGTAISAAVSGTDYEPAKGADDNYVTGAEKTSIGTIGSKAPSASPTFTGTVTLPKTTEIQDTTGDNQYVLAVSELTADRTITLPLLTGDDEFVFKDHAQTLTNKTLTSPTLTTPALGTPASGNLANCTFPTLNQNTTGYAEALKSATTTVSVSAATAPTSGQVLTATSGTAATWQTPSASGGGFWTAMPGTPTRTSNTTFTVTGDVTAYVAKGMVIKWTETGTVRNAMVSIPSTYGAPNTTITIVGDTMASIDASSLKYAMVGAEGYVARFAIAGAIGATGTDVANAYYATEPMRVLAADLQTGTAGTTNSTTIDVNKGGTTMFTTKPTLATTVATSPTPFTADSATSLALADKVTIDIDAVQTTAAIDLYAQLYLWPTRLNNLT